MCDTWFLQNNCYIMLPLIRKFLSMASELGSAYRDSYKKIQIFYACMDLLWFLQVYVDLIMN